MRAVSKSSTPTISKLSNTVHANLKEVILSGLFRLGSPVSGRQQAELSIVIGIDVAPIVWLVNRIEHYLHKYTTDGMNGLMAIELGRAFRAPALPHRVRPDFRPPHGPWRATPGFRVALRCDDGNQSPGRPVPFRRVRTKSLDRVAQLRRIAWQVLVLLTTQKLRKNTNHIQPTFDICELKHAWKA